MKKSQLAPSESAVLYMTADELGARLRIHPETIAAWAKKYPDLPRVTLPNHSLRFHASEVEAWMQKFNKKDQI
jgi:predicted site-specific integrase-resolvase